MLDPAPIGAAQWAQLGQLLTNLWIVVAFIVLFATNMLIGHIFIPSLIASQHIGQTFQKARPLFYLLAIVCFAVALFFLARVVDLAGVLRGFWPDYWW